MAVLPMAFLRMAVRRMAVRRMTVDPILLQDWLGKNRILLLIRRAVRRRRSRTVSAQQKMVLAEHMIVEQMEQMVAEQMEQMIAPAGQRIGMTGSAAHTRPAVRIELELGRLRFRLAQLRFHTMEYQLQKVEHSSLVALLERKSAERKSAERRSSAEHKSLAGRKLAVRKTAEHHRIGGCLGRRDYQQSVRIHHNSRLAERSLMKSIDHHKMAERRTLGHHKLGHHTLGHHNRGRSCWVLLHIVLELQQKSLEKQCAHRWIQ